MNELTPRGHLRPLGGRENPRRARPESRSPRRCAHARGAPYSPRAAPSILTKGEPTGTRAQVPSRSCTCAKALTETHPGVRDWLSATRICMQSKLGTPSWPLFLAAAMPHIAPVILKRRPGFLGTPKRPPLWALGTGIGREALRALASTTLILSLNRKRSPRPSSK